MTTKVSIWPKDEAFQRLLEASLVFKEIHGSFDYTAFLQQELAREIVVREYRASQKERLAAEAAIKLATALLGIATDALGFYADKDNYKPINGQPPNPSSAVAKDKGRTASQALEALTPRHADETDEEGEAE